MNVKRTNIALRIVTAGLAATAVLSLVIGFTSPLQLPEVSSQIQMPGSAMDKTAKLPPITSYTPIFARSLQSTASGMMAATATPVETQSSETLVPIAQLSLVGTIGNSTALIKGPDGTIGIVETGEDVNGSPVLAVRPSECDLRVNGKLVTLRLAPTPEDAVVVPSK